MLVHVAQHVAEVRLYTRTVSTGGAMEPRTPLTIADGVQGCCTPAQVNSVGVPHGRQSLRIRKEVPRLLLRKDAVAQEPIQAPVCSASTLFPIKTQRYKLTLH